MLIPCLGLCGGVKNGSYSQHGNTHVSAVSVPLRLYSIGIIMYCCFYILRYSLVGFTMAILLTFPSKTVQGSLCAHISALVIRSFCKPS